MELLARYDRSLFLLINLSPHPPIAVMLAAVLSGLGSFGFIWLLIGTYLVFREEKRDHGFFIPLGLAAGMVWLVSEFFMKNVLGRLRPPMRIPAALIYGPLPAGFSFPSTHATLAFALATVLSWKEPKWFFGFYSLAVLVGLSRVFLGYHYPSDVLAGSVIGWAIGWCCIFVYTALRKRKRRA